MPEARDPHRALAEKFVYKGTLEDAPVFDSLLDLVRFVYTEEEAGVVLGLDFTPVPARMVARRLGRPRAEVTPTLERMAARNVITCFRAAGMDLYSFLPLAPGVFEAQMARGEDTPYTRTFARLFEQVYREMFAWLQPRMRHNEMKFGRVIPIEQSLDQTPGLGVVAHATDLYSEMVDRNRSFCLVHACSCRHEAELIGKGCGRPKDVCSAMGALADFAVSRGLARRVSKEEFLEAKARAAAAGLVNMVDNVRDPMQVCSCCGCCCGALRILNDFNIPGIVTQSRFEALVDPQGCQGCGRCEAMCPMHAIRVEDGTARVESTRCIGCGVCVLQCDRNRAITLRERAVHTPPSETVGDYALSRYLEYRGLNFPVLNRASLGLGRLISRLSPFHLSGPKYRP